MELPEDIKGAIELLERFEKSKNHSQRIRDFEDAIDDLNGYLAENPNSSHKNRIENIKLTYIRKMIEQLPQLGSLSYKDWCDYFETFFLGDIGKEIDVILQQNPALRKNMDDFVAMWRKELKKDLERMGFWE